MLAQNFMDAADLGISEDQFAALYKVLGMLERQELTHHPLPKHYGSMEMTAFNLGAWHCGSVGCIGGWAEKVGNLPTASLITACIDNRSLDELFYPDSVGAIPHTAMDEVTTGQAAIALRNYLTHGEPRWAEAMAG